MRRLVSLGDVCEFVGGGTPNKKQARFYNGSIPWATVRDMRSDIIEKTEHNLTPDGLANSSAKMIPKNNVVIASRVGLGKVCITNHDIAINQDLKGVIPRSKDELNVKFLFYFFKSIAKEIIAEGTGATLQGVKLSYLQSIKLSLPPLEEQQRIIAKLDAAFSEIDRAIEVSLIRRFQSEALLKKMILEEFCSSSKKQRKTFADVCILQRGFDLPKSQRQAGNFPLFSANGITDYIDTAKVTAPGVITGRSGTIGAVHYTEREFWPLNTALYVKNFKANLPKYVFYFLQSFDLKKYASGTGVPTLNRNVLSEEIVWIASELDDQQRTCEKLDNATEKVTNFNQLLNKQIANYHALKSAILSQELKSEAA